MKQPLLPGQFYYKFLSNLGKILIWRYPAYVLLTLFFIGFTNPAFAQFTEVWRTPPLTGTGQENIVIISQAVDHEQNLIVLGFTGANTPERRLQLHKIDQNGNIIWARTYTGEPGSISNSPDGLKIDSKGNIYVSGLSDMAGTYKRFLIRYTADGTLAWSRFYSYEGRTNTLQSFTVGADDAIYVTGFFYDQQIEKGHIITHKLNTTGNIIWEKVYEPELTQFGEDAVIEVDNKGTVLVATNIRGFEQPLTFTLLKLSAATGEVVFKENYGSDVALKRELINRIRVSPSGNIYVFTSAKHPTDPYYTDPIMYILSNAGNLTSRVHVAEGVAYNNTPIFYITDVAFNASGELILLCQNARYRSYHDYFIAKYASDGTRVWLKELNTYEGNNIKQFAAQGFTILDNQAIAVIGSYSIFIQRNGFPPIIEDIEPSKIILALFNQSGNETMRQLNQKDGNVKNYGFGISKIEGMSFYATGGLGGTQPSTFAMKYTDCSGFTASAGSDKEICAGGSAQLQATGGTTYSWAPADGLSAANIANPVASPTATTTYTVTVTNAEGCTATDQVTITVNSNPTASITAGGATTFCAGGSVILTANPGTGYTYQWLKDGSPISQATGNTYTANAAGDYSVIVKNAGGCSATAASIKVTVTSAATVSAGADKEICAGGSVQLQASGGTTYSWSPAIGLSATNVANPTASPATTTTYTVTVSNASGCSATDQVVVTVNPIPTAVIALDGPTTFCQGGSVTLTANTGSGFTYQWLQDGNPINQATNSSFTTMAAGSYAVRITNSSGCSATSQPTIVTVTDQPVVNAGENQSICVNAAALTLTGFSPAGGTWSGPGVSANGLFNSATAGVGTHTLTYTVVQNSCTVRATKTITVTPAVAANAGSITGAATACAGAANLTYSIPQVAGATTYTWAVPNGFTITSGQGTRTITVTAGNSGGNISVRAQNSCGTSEPSNIALTINAIPAATITANGSTSLCEGGSVTLEATAGNGYTYQWQRDGATIAGATAATFTATASGNYTVTITNGTCAQTATAVAVTVTSGIKSNAITTSVQNLCPGAAAANLQGSTPTGGSGNFAYQWQQSTDGNSYTNIQGATSKDYNPGNLTATTWFRRTVAAGGCSSTSEAIKITVSELPTVSLNAFDKTCVEGTSITLTGGQPAGGTYIGPGVTNGIFNPSVAGPGTHTITYMYTNLNNCFATATQTIVVEETCTPTGVEDEEPPHKFVLFPNPAKDKLYIEAELPDKSDITIQLVDARGRIILQKDYTGKVGAFTETLSLENKARGMYFLRFTTKEGSYNRKVLLW